MYRRFAALLLLASATACGDLTYQAPVAWRGTLLPRTDAGVTGSVAAVSQGRRQTEAGFEMDGASNTTYGWAINTGTCANPGGVLGGRGAYADVATNNSGEGRIESTFVSALMAPGEQFHAVIVNATNRSLILACGDLEEAAF
ncbi:MAG TPA: hypothetical protein VFY65_04160 [Longimicrobium sp.]|nr:hypothetical protein [Longimicrobium sp.]